MRHVVVGAGPAGLSALETLRALEPDAELTLVCDEPPYSRMVLPYYLLGDVEERALVTGDDAWFERLRVLTLFGRRVTRIEPDADRLQLDDGSNLEFDRLLLATGSRAARLGVPGADAEGVMPMWTLDDARSFLARPHGEVVIVGAGFIGFTILDAFAARAQRVHLVESEPRVLPNMLDEAAAGLLEAQLEAKGVAVHTSARLEEISTQGERRLLWLSNGESLECDVAVSATGVQPNVEWTAGSGVAVDHGILVDERLATSRARVFAAGDAAQGPDLLGGGRRVQAIQPTAVDHGRVAAANMAGRDVAYAGSLTMNILATQGLEASSFGRWQGGEDATVVSNPRDRIYRKYVWQEDRLLGGILVGPGLAVSGTNDAGMLKGLVQTGVRLGPWRAHLEENPLELRRAYVASGAARQLLDSQLLAGHLSTPGSFRFPPLPPRRPRSPHHTTLVGGAG